MNRLFRIISIIFCIGSFFSSIYATELKKHNLSICAIFKNEATYLKEWIEYHRLVGVDHFYLYDNNSTDCPHEILNHYIKEGLVSLIKWMGCCHPDDPGCHWALSTQVTAFENALKYRALKETKWLVFVDIDEFLVPPGTHNLLEILEKYDEYPGVVLLSDHFDASVPTFPKRKLLIETLELTGAPEQNIFKGVEKTILKPELCESFLWPPYQCQFKNHQTAIALSRSELRINRYTNRYRGPLYVGKVKDKLYLDNRMLSENLMKDLLEEGYEIEDQERVIHRFVPELLKRMGYESGWNWR
jgi:Glycosyltransferase family 92